MTDDVVPLKAVPPIDCDACLEAAKGKLEQVLILGVDRNGMLFSSSPNPNLADAVSIMEQIKFQFFLGSMSIDEFEPEGAA